MLTEPFNIDEFAENLSSQAEEVFSKKIQDRISEIFQ